MIADAAASAAAKGDDHDRPHLHRSVHHPRRRRPGAGRPGRGPRGRLPVRRLAGAADRRGRRADPSARGSRGLDALVLGRRTYDIFASYWPHHTGRRRRPIAEKFNAIPKYVASAARSTLDWAGTSQLGPDAVAEVAALRERHERHPRDRQRRLRPNAARGRRVRRADAVGVSDRARAGQEGVPRRRGARDSELLEPPLVSAKGAVLLRYGPAGEVRTGDMGADDRELDSLTAERRPSGVGRTRSPGSSRAGRVRSARPRPTRCRTTPVPAGRRSRTPPRSG